jgi:hypothetical protein
VLAWPALVHLALIAGSVLLFYPFLFGGELGDSSGGPELDGERVTLAEHSVVLSDFLDGRGFAVLARSLWFYDPVLLTAGLVGAAIWAWTRLRSGRGSAAGERAELAVALSFAVPYLAVLGMYAKTYERFAIPALPFLAAAAGAGLERLAAGGTRATRRALGAAVALALLVPAAACARLAWLRSRPDTLDLAGAWIEAHLERSDPIALISAPRLNVAFDLPLWRERATFENASGKHIKQHSPWTRYQAALAGDPSDAPPGWSLRWLVPQDGAEAQLMARDYQAFILALAPGYFVIEPYEARFDNERMIGLRQVLREHGELVARFTPEGPEGMIEWPFFYMLSDHFNSEGHEDWPHCVPRLARAEAIGPAVEIYRVDERP